MVIASRLSRLLACRAGNILVMGGLMLPVMIGAAGLGLDTIQWTLTQRQLQRKADSAALAGAFAKAQVGTSTSAYNSATASLTGDTYVQNDAPTIEAASPTAGPYSGNTSAVRVLLQSTRKLPFSSMFMTAAPIIKVKSTAAAVSNGSFCVLALETTNTTGVTLQGNSTVNLSCGIASNSPATSSITAGGSSTIVASPISAVGGIPASSNYSTGTAILPHSIPQKDPFANLAMPSVPNPCATQLTAQPNTTTSVTNSTGTRCFAGIDIKGTVNFAPGIYIVNGGTLNFGSQAVVTGTGVVFLLTSNNAASNPSSIATLTTNGGAQLNLTAPTTGTYAGVLIYQDRRAINSSGNSINGNASSLLRGALYFPSQGISMSGDSGMNTKCLQVVGRRVTFIGNNRIQNECPDDSGSHAFLGTRVFLVN